MDAPARLVLLGHPVAHSISPRFQNAALQAAGIPLVYSALDVAPAQLDATLAMLATERAAGNVTIPYKEAVAARCTRRSPLAERCGAVNTFWHENGALVGDNSDVGGAESVLRALLGNALAGSRIALVGAGGAAASILCAAERCGAAEVRVYNRTMPRAQHLAHRFAPMARATARMDVALIDADLVVNATPIGLHDDEFPVPIDRLPPGSAVFDLIYRAHETPWVRAARAAGHRATDGEGMLMEQGAIAFDRWFGFEPDRRVMWQSLH